LNKEEIQELKKQIEFLHQLELDVSEEACDPDRVFKIQQKRVELENKLNELKDNSVVMDTKASTTRKKSGILFSVSRTKEEQKPVYHDLSSDLRIYLYKTADLVIRSGGSR